MVTALRHHVLVFLQLLDVDDLAGDGAFFPSPCGMSFLTVTVEYFGLLNRDMRKRAVGVRKC
jgi:hypothetical protein